MEDQLPDEWFVHKKHGKALAVTGTSDDPPPRDDLIMFSESKHGNHIRDIKIGPHGSPAQRADLLRIIRENWDAFDEEGVRRPVLGVEFHIDTGDAQPVCARQPNYGIHEKKIMQDQLDALIHNGMIVPNYGPWASIIVLAPKPHQEHVMDINDLVWRLCVSYRKLNSVTKPFRYPIPRCSSAVQDLGDSHGPMYFITVDAHSGFHQIACSPDAIDKLAFWGPDNNKWSWCVMPFGPMNGPTIFQCFMDTKVRRLWNKFMEELCRRKNWGEAVHWLTRQIIDDTLLGANQVDVLVGLFECVCRAFVAYRLSFKLKKCTFFEARVTYVGEDLTVDGNMPAESKFSLIRDWPLPADSQSLHSFISLCGFYQRFCPWFEYQLTPLRRLIAQYKHRAIPQMAWSPALLTLFAELKEAIVSSPCLARADSLLPFVIKTDWSCAAMGAILMQPDSSPESQAALAHLDSTGEFLFDSSLGGPRLRPVFFQSRRCTEKESHFHSYVGESAAGRWAIGKFRSYLWGAKFYWITDCSAVKALVEYDGSNHMLQRWAQDLLGYDFEVVHRSERMMRDVDALSRLHHPLVAKYMATAVALRAESFDRNPALFCPVDLSELDSKLSPADPPSSPEAVALPCHHAATLAPHSSTISSLVPVSSHTRNTLLCYHGRLAEQRARSEVHGAARLVHQRLFSTAAAPSAPPFSTEALPSDDLLTETLAPIFPVWWSIHAPLAPAVHSLQASASVDLCLACFNELELELVADLYPAYHSVLAPIITDVILASTPSFLGFDCTCRSLLLAQQQAWLSTLLESVFLCPDCPSFSAFCLFLPLQLKPSQSLSTSGSALRAFIDSAILPALSVHGWCCHLAFVDSADYGDCFSKPVAVLRGLFDHSADFITSCPLPDTVGLPTPYGIALEQQEHDVTSAVPCVTSTPIASLVPHSSHHVIHRTAHRPNSAAVQGVILDPGHPATVLDLGPDPIFPQSFGIPFRDRHSGRECYRPALSREILYMLRYDPAACALFERLSDSEQHHCLPFVVSQTVCNSFLDPLVDVSVAPVLPHAELPVCVSSLPCCCHCSSSRLPIGKSLTTPTRIPSSSSRNSLPLQTLLPCGPRAN